MGNVQFYNGVVLFNGGKVAMDPDCCCGNCICPCEDWPPASWPCGGLNETYSLVSWNYKSYLSNDGGATWKIVADSNMLAATTLTAISGEPCTYLIDDFTVHNQRYNEDGSECIEDTADISGWKMTYTQVDGAGCCWYWPTIAEVTRKRCNPSPVGTWFYTDLREPEDYTGCTWGAGYTIRKFEETSVIA